MSQWHLTVGETALFVPAGVVLGAVVSYFAVRHSTRATLEVQRAALDAAREQSAEQRHADLQREERDHRRNAYTELGGHLQAIADFCNYLVPAVLGTSLNNHADTSRATPGHTWSAFYGQILDLIPECRRLTYVYGSPDIRAAIGAIGALTRALGPPSGFTNGPGHWMHEMTQRGDGIATELITLHENEDHRTHQVMLKNLQIFQPFVSFGLARIRYELAPSSAPEPPRPLGLVDDPDVGTYVVATEPLRPPAG